MIQFDAVTIGTMEMNNRFADFQEHFLLAKNKTIKNICSD